MKKQWKQLLFSLCTVFILVGCGIQSVEEYEKMEADERSVEETLPAEPTPKVTESPVIEKVEEKVEEKVVPKEEVKEEAQPEPEKKVDVQPEPKTEVKSEPKQEVEPAPQIKEEPAPAPAPKEEPKPQPVDKKSTVTIAIYVHNLVANMDKLHPSLKSDKYVPASGVVLKPVTYELLSEEDTVWDVLKRATKEHSIQLEYEGADENIYDSVYIEGIHHLYEFSAGPLSGWMYSVNGVFPNVGASQQTLTDGDVIEWHYTLDLGRDLGKEV